MCYSIKSLDTLPCYITTCTLYLTCIICKYCCPDTLHTMCSTSNISLVKSTCKSINLRAKTLLRCAKALNLHAKMLIHCAKELNLCAKPVKSTYRCKTVKST